jgi:DNA-binding beta-propeller fold protein YncE
MNDLNPSRKLAARPRAGCSLALFLLAGLLAVVTPLRADNPPTYLFQIDASAVPGGLGFSPSFVALDSSNNVYVTDDNGNRVVKFTVGGTYLTQWGSFGSSNSQFSYPYGIAVDSSNNVYVADFDNNRVEKFDYLGNYLTQWGSYGSGNGQFYGPLGIAVDSHDDVFVSDNHNARIEKFNRNENYFEQWGSFGSGNGQFGYPQGVAVDSNDNIYLVDNYNNRVEKFDNLGNYLTQWGGYGSGNGQFNGPLGITVDSSNNVYVADSGNSRIEKFTSQGSYLAQWGSYGSGNSQFSGPNGVAVDSSGNYVYVTDFNNQRIQVFANNANIIPPFITQQPATNQNVAAGMNVIFSVGVVGPAPLAYQWTSNNVAVPGATNATFTLTNVSLSDSAVYSVLVTNRFGSALSSNAVFTIVPADEVPPTYLFEIDASAVPGGFGFSPSGVAVDSSRNFIYVADSGNFRVVKFAGNGTYLTQWGVPGGGYLAGIAVDSGNNIYVANNGNNRVEKFDSHGNYLTQWGSYGSGNGQFFGPLGIAVDNSNNIYVVDNNNNRVEKFDRNGNYLTQWGSSGSGNGAFNGPYGIAVDNGNNVYVADFRNSRVEEFDSNGNYLTQWGSSGSGNGQFSAPYGIAVDSSNHVYVTDDNNNRVEKFDSNGNYLTQWGSSGTGNSYFYNPEGIVLDNTGNFIYVADSGNSRVQVFVNNINLVPPIIMQQPTNQTVFAGINVTFSAGVIGAAPLAYQWILDDVAVPGATNATFTLTNSSPFDAGTYSVLVTDRNGSVLSSNAVLEVFTAMAITQPASGISATGAVLNGSVMVGLDQTVAWFEWGTDTNYGNIAGATIVPGNNGSNNISSILSGLSVNLYHYRLAAVNDFGIDYGDDQVFTLGFRPTATTLAAVNSANGSTLNATVNPNGWDTTVYFHWGTTALTNVTPGIDIGSSAVPLNASSLITNPAPAIFYSYEVVASNSLGVTVGQPVPFILGPWSIASVPNTNNWDAMASSADGTKLVAVNFASGPAGAIYVSTNSGASWTITSAPLGTWETVASSVDGTKLIAGGGGGYGTKVGPICTSTNSGATWITNNAPIANWQCVASSANGNKLVAVDLIDRSIYASTNSGAIWNRLMNAPSQYWYSIASSADGNKLVAVSGGYSTSANVIYTSANSGATWTLRSTSVGYWTSVASSADGNNLVAVGGGFSGHTGPIYTSANAGVTWHPTTAPSKNWINVASSADGTILAAAAVTNASGSAIYISTDSGTTWKPGGLPLSLSWESLAFSADGAELVAGAGYPQVGGIFYLRTTPAPKLNLSVSNNQPLLSWIIPSLDFTLQQSPDLMNWTNVMNSPVLNLTNLQNQVVLPPPGGNGFFRLLH